MTGVEAEIFEYLTHRSVFFFVVVVVHTNEISVELCSFKSGYARRLSEVKSFLLPLRGLLMQGQTKKEFGARCAV